MMNQVWTLLITSSMLPAVWGNGGGSVAGIHDVQSLTSSYSSVEKKNYTKYVRDYARVKNLNDFKNIYVQTTKATQTFGLPLQKEWDQWQNLTSNIKPGTKYPPQPSFQWAESAFPGIDVQLVAEGTMVALNPSWKKLSQLAKKTASLQDDKFTGLMSKLHGETWSDYPNWMVQTWDYGGCSRLGSGKHSYFLKALQIQIKAGSVFKSELASQQKYLVDNLLKAKDYCGPKAAALRELSEIQRKFSWSKAQRKGLNQQYQLIKSGKVSFGNAPS